MFARTRNVSVHVLTLTVFGVAFALAMPVARADVFFKPADCPGLGFIQGVVASGDVDVEDICSFIKGGGWESGAGFGFGGRDPMQDPSDACREVGGEWDGHRCHVRDRRQDCIDAGGVWNGHECSFANPQPCHSCAAQTKVPLGKFRGLPASFHGRKMVVVYESVYKGKKVEPLFSVTITKKY
jgi:hypothetical protein